MRSGKRDCNGSRRLIAVKFHASILLSVAKNLLKQHRVNSVGRRIILLSDGTGNSAAKVWRTNVWRLFQSLDLRSSDQVAMYDDGVGKSSFKPMALLSGAFGFGLKRNVLGLYKFQCRNYKAEHMAAPTKPAT